MLVTSSWLMTHQIPSHRYTLIQNNGKNEVIINYLQCGLSMTSLSIHTLFCFGSIHTLLSCFLLYQKDMDRLKRKRVLVNRDIIDGPHCTYGHLLRPIYLAIGVGIVSCSEGQNAICHTCLSQVHDTWHMTHQIPFHRHKLIQNNGIKEEIINYVHMDTYGNQ